MRLELRTIRHLFIINHKKICMKYSNLNFKKSNVIEHKPKQN